MNFIKSEYAAIVHKLEDEFVIWGEQEIRLYIMKKFVLMNK